MFSLWQFIFRPREGENSQFYFYQNTSKAISKNPYHVHNYSQRLSPGIIEGRVYHKQVWKANRIRIFILFTKKTFRTRRQAGNTLQAHINNQLTTTPCQEIRQPNHWRTIIPLRNNFHYCHPCWSRTSVCATVVLSILTRLYRPAPMQKQAITTADTLRSTRWMQTKENEVLLTSISYSEKGYSYFQSFLPLIKSLKGSTHLYNLWEIFPHK